ncbi:hypothetical protein EVAR_2270_1 [Eumeta japonica]|uniref:Uncharacterized protein n=1 Tax=Eumeta variegata TaxID=151549 RepID=A0A4C1SFS3_EUMVA|nr:hypothetical protein EVAR_2270_1 [Eumeta japonica]
MNFFYSIIKGKPLREDEYSRISASSRVSLIDRTVSENFNAGLFDCEHFQPSRRTGSGSDKSSPFGLQRSDLQEEASRRASHCSCNVSAIAGRAVITG